MILWTTIIEGYARNGCKKEVIILIKEIEHLGLSLDHVMFINILSTCIHVGLVKEDYQYFKSMSDYYHITPTIEHYTCMFDLLDHVGHIHEAKEFINNMQIKLNIVL